MGSRILLLEADAETTKLLSLHLTEGGHTVVHVPAVVAALRELQNGSFDLLITNTTVQREHDALKLLDVLLVERRLKHPPPVMVLTTDQDPAVIKVCARAGVADYVLRPADLKAVLPRVERVFGGAGIGERLVGETTVFLGPAARVLLDKGTRNHLKIPGLEALRREHLPELFRWIQTTVTPILKDKATALLERLEAAFHVKRGAG